MSAAPAYDYRGTAYERERFSRPDISVVPGRGRRPEARSLPSSAAVLARVAAVAIAVVAVICIARISLISSAVTTAMEAKELSSQIEMARADGNALEVAQSTFANPTRIKDAAADMGMVAPASMTKIELADDVVVTDEAGNLSLSGSVAAAAQN